MQPSLSGDQDIDVDQYWAHEEEGMWNGYCCLEGLVSPLAPSSRGQSLYWMISTLMVGGGPMSCTFDLRKGESDRNHTQTLRRNIIYNSWMYIL